jgi:hypothetical protein
MAAALPIVPARRDENIVRLVVILSAFKGKDAMGKDTMCMHKFDQVTRCAALPRGRVCETAVRGADPCAHERGVVVETKGIAIPSPSF